MFIWGIIISIGFFTSINIALEIIFSLFNSSVMTDINMLYLMSAIHFTGLICTLYVSLKFGKSLIKSIQKLAP